MSEDLVQGSLTPEIIPSYEKLEDEERSLIDKTIGQIKEIVNDAAVALMEKVGEVLITNFFDGNPELAREGINGSGQNTSKAQVFRTFIETIGSEGNQGKFAQKTWLYNSIKIVIDKRELENQPGYDKYKQLSISQKIELLPLQTPEEKIKLAQQAAENKWSVRQLREAMGEKLSAKPPSLLSLALHPEKIQDIKSIPIKSGKIKEKFLEKVGVTTERIEHEIATLQESLVKLKQLKERVEKYVPPKPGKKKKK